MNYIRTKDGRIVDVSFASRIRTKILKTHDTKWILEHNADTIEELCDCFSYETETVKDIAVARSWKLHNKQREIFGCIKTDKGLIYVAKMNEIGVLELL